MLSISFWFLQKLSCWPALCELVECDGKYIDIYFYEAYCGIVDKLILLSG
jgi:hypothetical protein